MMAGKYLCIALFATLQISFVLCRSTGTPDALVEESVMPTGEAVNAEALKQTVVPGDVTNDDFPIHVSLSTTYEGDPSAIIIVLVIYFVFLISSFILGCILYIRAKKRAVRPGRIVRSN